MTKTHTIYCTRDIHAVSFTEQVKTSKWSYESATEWKSREKSFSTVRVHIGSETRNVIPAVSIPHG
jgi:hypothetical protein